MSNGDKSISAMVAMRISIILFKNLYIVGSCPCFVVGILILDAGYWILDTDSILILHPASGIRYLEHLLDLFTYPFHFFIGNIRGAWNT